MMALTGPVRMDPHQEQRVRPQTVVLYKVEVARFVAWCGRQGASPQTAAEFDDWIVEYKQDQEDISRHQLTYLVAGVKFFFPAFRRQLPWIDAVLSGWEKLAEVKHTVPLPKILSKLMAIKLLGKGLPRMGLALVLQTHTGLRPGELLALQPEHFSFPQADGHSLLERPVFISLGVKTGTKVGRPQVSRIQPRDAVLSMVVAELLRHSPVGTPIFTFNMAAYRRQIQLLDASMMLNAGFGAHSPRSGYATDSLAEGVGWEEVRAVGRWEAEASFRRYVDQVAADRARVMARTLGLAEVLVWADRYWFRYFLPL